HAARTHRSDSADECSCCGDADGNARNSLRSMTDFLLSTLAAAGVEFIRVGGVAAAAHGGVRTTLDLDFVYGRSPENIRRLVSVLRERHPYPRGAPPGLPFVWDERTLPASFSRLFATREDPVVGGSIPGVIVRLTGSREWPSRCPWQG